MRSKIVPALGVLLALVGFVVPRIPLLASGFGTGRLSVSGAAGLCAGALGQLAAAFSAQAANQCGYVRLASAGGWIVLLGGLALLLVPIARRALRLQGAR